MIGLYAAGALMIVMGAVMLLFPGIANSINRLNNDLEGVETNQGETYKLGQKVSAVTFIIMGIVMIYIPSQLS